MIVKKMEPYFKDTSLMQPKRFLKIEALLNLMERLDAEGNPYKANLLLSDYDKLLNGRIKEGTYAIFSAKTNGLMHLRSKNEWEKALEEYQNPVYDAIRAYNIVADGSSFRLERRTDDIPCPITERVRYFEDTYFSHGNDVHNPLIEEMAPSGVYLYKNKSVYLDKDLKVSLFKGAPVTVKGPREAIRVSIEDLLQAADEMLELVPSDYSARVLRENILLKVREHEVVPSDALTLDKVVNVLGMVGAGKSTLIRVLVYWLAKQGYRIVITTDSVANVFSLVEDLIRFDISVSPLIGKTDRNRYINQLHDEGKMTLSSMASSYLTSACVLDGFAQGNNAVGYGAYPCFGITEKEPKEGREKPRTYPCPFFNSCNATKMLRECYYSNIVVTTVQGLAASSVGASGELFLHVVLDTVDLVIYDESDRAQHVLDIFFFPTHSFEAFNQSTVNSIADHMFKTPEERRANLPLKKYDTLLRKAEPYMQELLDSVLDGDFGKWEAIGDNHVISGLMLLNDFKESEELSDEIYNELLTLMNPQWIVDQNLRLALRNSLEVAENFDYHYNLWRGKRASVFPFPEDKRAQVIQDNKLKLIIKLMQFDYYLREVAGAYEKLEEEERGSNRIHNFLRSRFSRQQRFLPAGLTGNIMGLKIEENKDLKLLRHYAFGRSLMNALPYLRVEADNTPAGPHVLMLSGSSWAEGCLSFHVNRPVDYILDIPQEKKEFLAKTRFFFSGSQIRVSGSMPEKRQEQLELLTRENVNFIIDALSENSGKILLIVNSYDEAETLAKVLVSSLNGEQCAARVVAMSSDDAPANNAIRTISRGEVYRFADSEDDILIAPAMAIERGHNIVDESGHSAISHVFFMTRPMPVPNDVQLIMSKVNGLVEARAQDKAVGSILDLNQSIRKEAIIEWYAGLLRTQYHLQDLPKEIQTDVIATVFVVILQIFGRLARIGDYNRKPPTVGFIDGAFHAPVGKTQGFDLLNGLNEYLDNLMNGPNHNVAEALYGPFYKAFKMHLKELDIYGE